MHSSRQKRTLLCNLRCVRPGVCQRVGLLGGLGVGERLRAVARVGFWGLFERMHAGGRICNLVCGIGPGQGFIWGMTGCSGGMAAVQQQSTATHTDGGGRAGTGEDGDLQGWTWVDVLPPDGMQEVSGSSPLSSTWSEVIFERLEQRVQQESTATAAGWAAARVFGSVVFPRLGCWQDTGSGAPGRR